MSDYDLGVNMLRAAFRSHDLHLAIDRLHLFVADFQLDWSQVSGQEWRRYLLAWALLVLSQILSKALFFLDDMHQSGAIESSFWLVFRCPGACSRRGFFVLSSSSSSKRDGKQVLWLEKDHLRHRS